MSIFRNALPKVLIVAVGFSLLGSSPSVASDAMDTLAVEAEAMVQDVTAPTDQLPIDSKTALKIAEGLQAVLSLPSTDTSTRLDASRELEDLADSHPTEVANVLNVSVTEVGEAELNRIVVPGSASAIENLSASAAAAVYPTSRTLSMTHSPQETGYWCGPATAKMLLGAAGKTKSADSGAALTQTKLASTSYLGTTASAGTPWASARMSKAVNKWWGSGYYAQVQSPSVASLKGAFYVDIIMNKVAPALSTVEFAGGSHYNGHPKNKTIGHWVVGYRTANDGADIGMKDPATSVWSGVSSSFNSTASSFQKFVATNGVMY